MPLFEIEGPNGEKYELEAADERSAVQAFKKFSAQQSRPTPSPNPPTAPHVPAPELNQGGLPTIVKGLISPAWALGEAFSDSSPDALYATQQADRGIADALGAPVDLAAMGLNAAAWGADKVAEQFGGNFDTRITKPFLGSDWIADAASSVYEGAGGTVVKPEDVSAGTRIAGMGARGATAALVPALGLASGPAQAAGQTSRAMKGLTKPYESSAGATLARDAAAGAGAGTAAQSYDDFAPEAVQNSPVGPFLKFGAALLGGLGGVGLESVIEGLGSAGVKGLRNAVSGAQDPVAAQHGVDASRDEMDMAARLIQGQMSDREQAVRNLDSNLADFSTFAKPDEIPTTGMLVDDIGGAMQENTMRAKNPKGFAERDAARRAAAYESVEQSVPDGSRSRAFTQEATRLHDAKLGAAQKRVDVAETQQKTGLSDIQRQNTELEGFRARQPEASAEIDRTFRTELEAARNQKNELYNSVSDATPVDGGRIYEEMMDVEASIPRAARTGTEYSNVSGRIRDLLRNVDPETGDETLRDLTYGDLKVLRADVNAMRKEAVASGRDVTYLDRVGRVLGDAIDEINPEARRFYAEEFQPKFKSGRAGEYEAALKRAARTGEESSGTRPSEFGGKFLRKPEDAASLQRAIDVNAKPQTTQQATEWMLGDLAKSGVLTDNAELRFDRFRQWADKNKAVIDQFPAIRQRVNQEMARAQKGGMLSKHLAQDVAAAKGKLRDTESQLSRSALSSSLGKSPKNAVDSIMGSGDPERQMAEMVGRLKGNTGASNGLKAATREWIYEEAGLTSKIVGRPEAVRLSRANLEKLFTRHEKTLAKLYSPEEMNALRQAHKLMGAEAKLDVRTTAGSNTVDKAYAAADAKSKQMQRVLEGGLKARYGVLKGGGIMRTINLFLQSLPDNRDAMEQIVLEFSFNPELAKHLLTRPVKEVGTPAWNARLNALLATATGARESVEEGSGEKRKPLELTVGRPREE